MFPGSLGDPPRPVLIVLSVLDDGSFLPVERGRVRKQIVAEYELPFALAGRRLRSCLPRGPASGMPGYLTVLQIMRFVGEGDSISTAADAVSHQSGYSTDVVLRHYRRYRKKVRDEVRRALFPRPGGPGVPLHDQELALQIQQWADDWELEVGEAIELFSRIVNGTPDSAKLAYEVGAQKLRRMHEPRLEALRQISFYAPAVGPPRWRPGRRIRND
jgi:hypothetical protein